MATLAATAFYVVLSATPIILHAGALGSGLRYWRTRPHHVNPGRRVPSVGGSEPSTTAAAADEGSCGWPRQGLRTAIADAASLAARIRHPETGPHPRLDGLDHTRLTRSSVALAGVAVAFLASVWTLGGPVTVRRATGTGLGAALLRNARESFWQAERSNSQTQRSANRPE